MRHLEDLPLVIEKIISGMNGSALPRKTYYPRKILFTYMSASVVSCPVKIQLMEF